MIKEPKYLIKFTHAYNDNGTVWYTITVIHTKDGKSWSFKSRYSRMRELHDNCEKTKYKRELPDFPSRRLLNNTKEEFIQKRKKELENYYITLFRSIEIDVFPELHAFFNTNRPVEEVVAPSVESNEPPAIKKEKMLRKIFDDIVQKAQADMIESDDFDRKIEGEAQRKINQQFQRLRLALVSDLLDKPVALQGCNDSDFHGVNVSQRHTKGLHKLDQIAAQVIALLENRKQDYSFILNI